MKNVIELLQSRIRYVKQHIGFAIDNGGTSIGKRLEDWRLEQDELDEAVEALEIYAKIYNKGSLFIAKEQKIGRVK